MAPKPQTKTSKSKKLTDLDEISAQARPVLTKTKQAKIDREKAAAEELAGLSDHFKSIKEIDKRMKIQRDDTMDSEYWICICFQSRAQKEEFLRLAKMPKTIGDKYLDGMKVAKILGLELTTPIPPIRKHKGVEKTTAKYALHYDPNAEL